MVANLSLGKRELEAYQPLLQESLKKTGWLAASLARRVDLDTEAFNGVMAAFKMPKGTDQEKAARRQAILAGYIEAVKSPLGIAEECLEVLRLGRELLGKFNLNALSDFGVAALEAQTGLEGAAMNIRINLPSIKDTAFVAATKSRLSAMIEEGRFLRDEIYNYVQENLG
jgi:formiminotetrahydrofolate cyclodeaminase